MPIINTMQTLITRPIIFICAASFLLLSACQPGDTSASAATISAEEEKLYLEKSEALAGQLQKALGSRLMAAMEEGGPINGIEVCQNVAQDITQSVANQDPNISISRTALRVRNPANAADPYSASVLKQWQSKFTEEEKLEADLKIAADAVIVHRPIMTAPICLQCHGEASMIQEDTRHVLQASYPHDQATGFKEGDLRGAFRIVFSNRAEQN